jgi:hypothetical protein
MKGRVRYGLMRLPGGVGYRLASALHVRKPPTPNLPLGTAPADRSSRQNGAGGGQLTVELEGRSKRLRVRAAGDIWSDEFRAELARDRHFEASLAWRELVILMIIAAILIARSVFG